MITIDELILLIDRRRFGIPPGHGYAEYRNIRCPKCGDENNYLKAVYTKGYMCYHCFHTVEDWVWWPPKGIENFDGPCLNPVGIKKMRIITNN